MPRIKVRYSLEIDGVLPEGTDAEGQLMDAASERCEEALAKAVADAFAAVEALEPEDRVTVTFEEGTLYLTDGLVYTAASNVKREEEEEEEYYRQLDEAIDAFIRHADPDGERCENCPEACCEDRQKAYRGELSDFGDPSNGDD